MHVQLIVHSSSFFQDQHKISVVVKGYRRFCTFCILADNVLESAASYILVRKAFHKDDQILNI